MSATKRRRSEEEGLIQQWAWGLPGGESTGSWHARSCNASATGGVEGVACQEGEPHSRKVQSVSGEGQRGVLPGRVGGGTRGTVSLCGQHKTVQSENPARRKHSLTDDADDR